MTSLFSLHNTASTPMTLARMQSICFSDQPRTSISSDVVSGSEEKKSISRDLSITISFRKQLEPLYLHFYVKLASYIIFSYRYSHICGGVYEHLFLCYCVPLKEFIEHRERHYYFHSNL